MYKNFTGIYNPYQYENLQIRLDIDNLIWVNLHLSCEQVFPLAVYGKN